MTHICERLVVHCPDQDASRYLAAFVAEHQVGDGSVHIALRPAIVMSADRRSLIERRVVATLNSLQSKTTNGTTILGLVLVQITSRSDSRYPVMKWPQLQHLQRCVLPTGVPFFTFSFPMTIHF